MAFQQTLPGLRHPEPVDPRGQISSIGQPAADQPAADQPATDRNTTDQSTTDRPATDRYTTLPSPVGPMFVAFAGERVVMLSPAEDATAFEWRFRGHTGRTSTRVSEAPAWLRAAVGSASGNGLGYDLDRLSRFEQAVLAKTAEIPTGEVRPYAWVAMGIGAPKAVRAVGAALSRNPVPLLIPCHRVVRSDGFIGEYALGPTTKHRLLTAEGLDVDWLERLARGRVRFMGAPSGRWCYPTCASVRATPPEDQAPFVSAAAAAAAGYQPCERCQPAFTPPGREGRERGDPTDHATEQR